MTTRPLVEPLFPGAPGSEWTVRVSAEINQRLEAPKKRHYSATQVQLFRNCKRAWALKYLAKVEVPSAPWQNKGKVIDSAITDYCNTSVWTSPHVEAAIVAGALPRPTEIPHAGYRAQYAIKYSLNDDLDFVGFIDRLDLRGDPIEIIDDKSTSDFKYAKTQEQLAKDVQLLSYAFLFDQKKVKLSHHYHLTRGKPKVKVVSCLVTPDQIAEGWNETRATIDEAEAVRAAWDGDGNSVEATGTQTGHCSAYRGCPHRQFCGLDQGMFPVTMDPTKPNRLMELLKLGKKAPPPPENPFVPGVVEIQPNPPMIEPPNPVVAPAANFNVLPPDAAPRDRHPPEDDTAELPAVEPPKRGRGRPKTVREEGPTMAEVNQAMATSAGDPGLAAEVERLKGEITRVSAERDSASDAHAQAERIISDLQALQAAQKPKTEAPKTLTFVLYIDCFPTKGGGYITSFEDWAGPAVERAAEVGQVADAGLVQYGQGRALVASALRELTLPEALYVSSKNRWWDVGQEILVPRATRIVKGV